MYLCPQNNKNGKDTETFSRNTMWWLNMWMFKRLVDGKRNIISVSDFKYHIKKLVCFNE